MSQRRKSYLSGSMWRGRTIEFESRAEGARAVFPHSSPGPFGLWERREIHEEPSHYVKAARKLVTQHKLPSVVAAGKGRRAKVLVGPVLNT